MPKLTATETLRAMLDECGVEWEAPMSFDGTARYDTTAGGFWFHEFNGKITIHGLTPEQAIAATLGDTDATGERQGVADLAAENAKLREELEQWHKLTAGIELPEYPITQFQPKDLERENAKLRKLVRDWRDLAVGGADSLTDWNHKQADLEQRMRALGVEVNR